MPICDYTDNSGLVSDGSLAALQQNINSDPTVDAADLANAKTANSRGDPIPSCVGSGPPQYGSGGGLSPVVIGLGILGAGAAAVALSQRDE